MANQQGNMIPLTDETGQISMTWSRPTPLKDNQNGLFGPGIPVMPMQPLERPRIFQYTPGVNLYITPRTGFGLVSFSTLRNLAAACKEVRLNIELIKREVSSLNWEIVPTDKKDKTDYSKDIERIKEFLEKPDGHLDFDAWGHSALEEILVTDALSIYLDETGGDLNSMDLVDGTTIRPVLDYRGKVARPPVSYIQILYGMPAGYWGSDELIYKPMNTTVSSPYGTSPIEFILMAVNLALHRDVYHVGYFTEGNIPEALVGAPASWGQDQINTFQTYWDALLTGDVTQQRKMHLFPVDGGRGTIPVFEFHKDNVDMTAQDEWLMKIACWAFGNSPSEFGITNGGGLGGTGYAQAQENIQYRSMIGPVTSFLERIFTSVVRHPLHCPYLRFKWVGLEPTEDILKAAQADQINIQSGVYDASFVQDRDGIPPEHRPSSAPATNSSSDELDISSPEVGKVKKFFRSTQSHEKHDWQSYP